jgi:hypothetical protein
MASTASGDDRAKMVAVTKISFFIGTYLLWDWIIAYPSKADVVPIINLLILQ